MGLFALAERAGLVIELHRRVALLEVARLDRHRAVMLEMEGLVQLIDRLLVQGVDLRPGHAVAEEVRMLVSTVWVDWLLGARDDDSLALAWLLCEALADAFELLLCDHLSV